MDWTVDCTMDRTLLGLPTHTFDYLGFRHVHVQFCITAKLYVPCQLVHRPFEFLLAQYASVFLRSITMTSLHESPHWSLTSDSGLSVWYYTTYELQ